MARLSAVAQVAIRAASQPVYHPDLSLTSYFTQWQEQALTVLDNLVSPVRLICIILNFYFYFSMYE